MLHLWLLSKSVFFRAILVTSIFTILTGFHHFVFIKHSVTVFYMCFSICGASGLSYFAHYLAFVSTAKLLTVHQSFPEAAAFKGIIQ